jgi:hypothetical protein
MTRKEIVKVVSSVFDRVTSTVEDILVAELEVNGPENYDQWSRKTPSADEIDEVINELKAVSQDIDVICKALIKTRDKSSGEKP